MSKPKKNSSKSKQDRLQIVAFYLVILCAISTASFAVIFYVHARNVVHSRTISTTLREEFWELTESEPPDFSVYLHPFDKEMLQINPDFIAWITVDGTPIDYPVVRGNDNERYMTTSFYGEQNIFGTLFMDYRNRGSFVPHIIIYGHNSRNDRKFSSLRRFLPPIPKPGVSGRA